MELRIEPTVASGSIAPPRAQKPADREALLLPLTLRERAAVSALALALPLFEREHTERSLLGEPVTAEFFQGCAALMAAFRDVTGVPWSEAQKFW